MQYCKWCSNIFFFEHVISMCSKMYSTSFSYEGWEGGHAAGSWLFWTNSSCFNSVQYVSWPCFHDWNRERVYFFSLGIFSGFSVGAPLPFLCTVAVPQSMHCCWNHVVYDFLRCSNSKSVKYSNYQNWEVKSSKDILKHWCFHVTAAADVHLCIHFTKCDFFTCYFC